MRVVCGLALGRGQLVERVIAVGLARLVVSANRVKAVVDIATDVSNLVKVVGDVLKLGAPPVLRPDCGQPSPCLVVLVVGRSSVAVFYARPLAVLVVDVSEPKFILNRPCALR